MSDPNTIHDLPEFDRPREKLEEKGAEALHKRELLAILLGTGIEGKSALKLADDILEKYGGDKLLKASYQELENLPGIGPAKSCQIMSALELGSRLFREKEEKEVYINSVEDVLEKCNNLRDLKNENFVVMCLNARNKLLLKKTVFIGTLDASLVHPREIFKPAIENSAASVILVHNHPSGDPEPSQSDIKNTKDIVEAGEVIGIDIKNHVIIAENDYFSFKDKNYL